MVSDTDSKFPQFLLKPCNIPYRFDKIFITKPRVQDFVVSLYKLDTALTDSFLDKGDY